MMVFLMLLMCCMNNGGLLIVFLFLFKFRLRELGLYDLYEVVRLLISLLEGCLIIKFFFLGVFWYCLDMMFICNREEDNLLDIVSFKFILMFDNDFFSFVVVSLWFFICFFFILFMVIYLSMLFVVFILRVNVIFLLVLGMSLLLGVKEVGRMMVSKF